MPTDDRTGRCVAVVGADPALVSQALTRTVDSVRGDDGDVTWAELGPGALADCATLPMFASRRVTVFRRADSAADAAVDALCAYLADVPAFTTIVLEWNAAALPAKLRKLADSAAVEVIDANGPRNASGRAAAIAAKVRDRGVELDRPARALLVATVGEDLARVDPILELLTAVYPTGRTLGAADIEPYLGANGTVPPWDLTDAVSDGDSATALRVLARLLDARGRHPLAVLAVLRTHFERLLTVAASGARDEKTAAKVLGICGSTFPAKKALSAARRLGDERIERALELLAVADGDLKGRSGVPARMIAEVLVARLAVLHRR